MPIATSDDQRAVADAVRSWAARAQPVGAARRQERVPDAWREHWDDVAGLGLFGVAVAEADGGAGGTVSDLAVLLEQAAGALVPGPVVTTALAGLVLPPGAPGLTDIAAGRMPVAVGFGSPALGVADGRDGGVVVRGTTGPVLGTGAGCALLLGARVGDEDVWLLLEADAPGVKVADLAPADFSRGLAEIALDDVAVPASQVFRVDGVGDLAATLFAAEAAGVAAWCLRTAVEYAKLREQFGKPIGSFQAVKHLCAEMLCRAEQAAAVAWDAAQAALDPAQRPIATAVAAAVALDAAVDNAKDCIQVLGGIGFTWEHDAHLYLRRAVALRQLLGGSARWRRRAAELTIAGTRRSVQLDLGDVSALRAQVRSNVTRIASLPDSSRRAALVDAGYLVPHWPAPYGLAAEPVHQLVIDEELAAAGVPRPDLGIAGWAVGTIAHHGTPAQIERFVAPTLRGELTWCQLFSEPGAGSDLASLRTKAERVEGGWRLTGQKVWTSLAHESDWAICLARTDPDAPKHKGITYFLVDLTSPGIDVRPLREITGEELFNEVFLDGVFVAEDLVVGDLNDGWRLARATLAGERLAMGGGSSIGDAVERLVAAAVAAGLAGDECVLDRLGGHISAGLAGTLLDVRATLRRLGGTNAGGEESVRKLVGVRHRQAVAETGLDLLGAAGAADSDALHAFLLTRCLTIAGGTTQVLLSLIGERILGLPRG